jgi:hypothetical protein
MHDPLAVQPSNILVTLQTGGDVPVDSWPLFPDSKSTSVISANTGIALPEAVIPE